MADVDGSLATEADLDADDVVTVASLNAEIASVIEARADLNHDYVVGDVSDLSESNGHVHFDLVYEEASIHCVLFGFRRNGASIEPEEEMQAAVRGELSYYEERGSCSLLVTDVVDIGESEYSQVYEQNRQLLAEHGLLADERKQTLPDLPSTVGLVTSADSAAKTDAVTAIHDCYPDVDIKLQHATVQGPDALQELMGGISGLDDDATVDIIVVTRGGGADKTLRVFNETPLCRVIAGTETPIVAGIGHEDDRTLAGEVADHRVMTPTEAGKIVPERAAKEQELSRLSTNLKSAYETAVETQLAGFGTALDNVYETEITTHLQNLEASLSHATKRQVETELLNLQAQLNGAYDAVERKKEHEEVLAETVETVREEATANAQAEVEATRRRYRLLLVALFLLAILLFVLFGL